VPEAISDTGPVLHLQEIGKLATLAVVEPLILPDLVSRELAERHSGASSLQDVGVKFRVSRVETSEWQEVLRTIGSKIQPADAQVFVLARAGAFQALTLTDDLALRQLLERHGCKVAGSVGILVRAYVAGKLSRDDLANSFDALTGDSTLHLSWSFRNYLRALLKELPE
jgi:predicted nucleic acid-binding protein